MCWTCKKRTAARSPRELHDELGQELTALKLIVDQAVSRSDGQDALDGERQVEILDRLFSKVRDFSFHLRPTALDDLGLVAALERLAKYHEENTQPRGELRTSRVGA